MGAGLKENRTEELGLHKAVPSQEEPSDGGHSTLGQQDPLALSWRPSILGSTLAVDVGSTKAHPFSWETPGPPHRALMPQQLRESETLGTAGGV